jgi:hypothetical protein
LWPDVHSALANKIRQYLTPHLRPRYVARLAIAVIHDDDMPDSELNIMYPDVEVLKMWRLPEPPLPPPPPATAGAGSVIEAVLEIPTAPLILPILPSSEVRQITVEIHDGAQNLLITSIEILLSVNKRVPNLTKYRQKRQRLHEAGVHLLEIDLLRRGKHPLTSKAS